MPKPLDFATSNMFNSSKPPADENGGGLRDAIIREYKEATNTRNRSELMHSEGENLTVTADPSVFEDHSPLTHLKEREIGATTHPGLGGAASKLQQVL